MSRFSSAAIATMLVGCATQSAVDPNTDEAAATTGFRRIDLAGDQQARGVRQDADVVNAWGIATGEGGFWIADNGTGALSIFDANGAAAHGEYTSGAIRPGEGITGMVANHTTGFDIHDGVDCATSEFLIASEDGRVFGVAGDLSTRKAFVVLDDTGKASYKGIAVAMVGGKARMYLADFMTKKVEMYDGKFAEIENDKAFHDPDLPDGYGPFNVAAVGTHIIVNFAVVGDDGDEVAGAGLGIVDMFDLDGTFVQRLQMGGTLNAPWGIALAPSSFGRFGGALLVGNFGDGTITAIDLASGRALGQLETEGGDTLVVDGLWGITFGDGDEAGDPNTLYFAAGPGDEAHGLFGRIESL